MPPPQAPQVPTPPVPVGVESQATSQASASCTRLVAPAACAALPPRVAPLALLAKLLMNSCAVCTPAELSAE